VTAGGVSRPGTWSGRPGGSVSPGAGGRPMPRPAVNMPSPGTRQNIGRVSSGGPSHAGRASLNSRNSGRGGRFSRD
jgi:hypothetical protein